MWIGELRRGEKEEKGREGFWAEREDGGGSGGNGGGLGRGVGTRRGVVERRRVRS